MLVVVLDTAIPAITAAVAAVTGMVEILAERVTAAALADATNLPRYGVSTLTPLYLRRPDAMEPLGRKAVSR